ncbi:MAG TPA: hypothetical protein VK501_25615 [Baekduia sp.]|uniref:hypothetical protein n=1 Tax=Baekduia sp. TaxID=2600305 RepID=UPI002CA64447|nr:hypothetical protein [Baekduia sp.]HMJ37308.1 hypothetical protein [Baekduia sp.]
MLTDHQDVLAVWRRAEASVYPSVMVNAALYEQYLTTVRAVAEELADVRTDEALFDAWHERRDVAAEVVARSAPSMRAFMDVAALRDAAFCHRHRQISRERAKEIARERLERARREHAAWVVLFEDVTPLGSQRLEMHVRSGRAIHASSRSPLDSAVPTFELEVVQLDPATGAWLVDQPPIVPARTYHSHEEWDARIQQARATFGGGAS